MSLLQKWVISGVIPAAAAEQLKAFAALIHKWNPRINLTGFKSLAEIEEILIGESIGAWNEIRFVSGSVVDFGSGAGIPGLVWCVCAPSLEVTSVEVRQKKVAFQKHVRRELGIHPEILSGHFPEVVERRRFDMVTSRATRLDTPVWEKAEAVLNPGGRLVRFARPGAEIPTGWRSARFSERTELLIRP